MQKKMDGGHRKGSGTVKAQKITNLMLRSIWHPIPDLYKELDHNIGKLRFLREVRSKPISDAPKP